MRRLGHVSLGDRERTFLERNHSAAMITVGADGVPKAARVGIALVDDGLWSSGTSGRARTRRLRRDPRCTLFVFDAAYSWMALETAVKILEGPDAPQHNLRLFRLLQRQSSGPLSWFGRELDEDEFLEVMADERRLIYQFGVQRIYGMY